MNAADNDMDKSGTELVWKSALENGVIISERREVGSYVWTQWGKRKVISCKLVEYNYEPDMPEGC